MSDVIIIPAHAFMAFSMLLGWILAVFVFWSFSKIRPLASLIVGALFVALYYLLVSTLRITKMVS